MIFELPTDDIFFPDPHLAESDGLLAIGGDLSEERMLLAYENGIFPWYSFHQNDMPMWYCPHERTVIFPDEIHVSHSMRSLINKGIYHVTINRDFEGVIRGCSTAQDRYSNPYAWLSNDIIDVFLRLHKRHRASSIEVWDADENLVGGLYGVTVNKCFMGDSMFSLVPSASKLALISLARYMQRIHWKLIDCQLETPHLVSMGARKISYDEFMAIVKA